MKQKLKKKFDDEMWAETFDIRRDDLGKNMTTTALKSNWPLLFTKQGVIVINL